MPITALYGGVLAILFLILSIRVILARRKAGIALGSGDDRGLLRAMRVQANCAEYVPIGLILMGLAESLGMPAGLLHALGAAFLVGRTVHSLGVAQEPETLALRITGMSLTLTSISILAFIAIYGAALRNLGL